MNKIRLTAALVVAFSLMFTFSTASQDTDTVRIKVDGSQGSEFEATSDENVVIFWRWRVCSPGQDQAFLRALNQNYHELDGVALFTSFEDAQQYWGPIHLFEIREVCVGNRDNVYVTFWEYDLGQLAVGTHYLHSIASLAHRVTDGFDGDGDGRPDSYSGLLFDQQITITVVAASE
jgi:hypothetical protein